MEFEQIVKKLDWLDEQQRKSKLDFGDQNGRLASMEAILNGLMQQMKTMSQQINDLQPIPARINQFDQMIIKQRADLGKMVGAAEKNLQQREQETAKLHAVQIEEVRKRISEIGKTITVDEAGKKDRAREAQRIATTVQDIRASVEAAVQQSKDAVAAQMLFEESHRQDGKRLVDIQAELASVRKRADDAREKVTLHTDSIRNMENRINQLLETETTRQEHQTAFMQKQAMAEVERDRVWKEWQEKYEGVSQKAASMEAQLVTVEEAIRAAKRAQEIYDDLSLKLERRIAEVGEMQRLGEDRVRQEWVAFKAEEQKRWTAYSLTQDESSRDLRKDIDASEKRLTALDDAAQVMQDQLQQTADATEKQLQELMNVAHEWLSAYERIMGHVKTKVKKAVR
jgi:chromosome segregation ATPase